MARPSKEQLKRLSGGGSSLVLLSTGQAGRVSGSRVQGPPSLAGAGAGPEHLHSSHQLQDSTALGRGKKGFHQRGHGKRLSTTAAGQKKQSPPETQDPPQNPSSLG